VLNSPNQFYGNSSPTYTLTLYPTQDLFDVYATRNPISAMVGSVCIVILTALAFFLYDFVVRAEFHHKDALDSARRQFVRFISHEVRTPLNAVCMGLQLQHDESERLLALVRSNTATTTSTTLTTNDVDSSSTIDPVEDKLSEMAALGNDILANATSAVDVLNDLLNYDKVESGTLRLELTVIKIWELIEQTFYEFHQQATFNDVNYVLDLSAFQEDEEKQITSASELSYDVKNRKVIGDKVRLVQVLRNLISNAIKFSKDKDTLTVRPSWKKSDKSQTETEITLQSGEKVQYLRCGDLQVEVQDTGQGLTKEQLNSLFREGVQFNVNELQAGQGSGLGLYIAKGILEQHGGSLSATSEGIGCGTIFTMTIPLYYIPDPPDTHQAVPLPMKRRNDTLEKVEPLQVLVVDDSNMNRKLLTRLLSLHGHVCHQAEDGALAVQSVKDLMASGSRYDAILMDYEMPVMDGPTAAKQMRGLGSDSFIVGITGNLFQEDVAHFQDCGANLVLPKPLDVRVLMDAFLEQGIVTLAA
jgi:signal transduction histidine kinase/ActR/RegA family two-component response regulator